MYRMQLKINTNFICFFYWNHNFLQFFLLKSPTFFSQCILLCQALPMPLNIWFCLRVYAFSNTKKCVTHMFKLLCASCFVVVDFKAILKTLMRPIKSISTHSKISLHTLLCQLRLRIYAQTLMQIALCWLWLLLLLV